jgi:hypothetical protein
MMELAWKKGGIPGGTGLIQCCVSFADVCAAVQGFYRRHADDVIITAHMSTKANRPRLIR